MYFIFLLISKDLELEAPSKFAKIWIAIVAVLFFIFSALVLLTCFGLSWEYAIYSFILLNITNLIIFLIGCMKKH